MADAWSSCRKLRGVSEAAVIAARQDIPLGGMKKADPQLAPKTKQAESSCVHPSTNEADDDDVDNDDDTHVVKEQEQEEEEEEEEEEEREEEKAKEEHQTKKAMMMGTAVILMMMMMMRSNWRVLS